MVYLWMLSGFFLSLRLMAVVVDGPKVAVIVRAAMGHGQDVVNLISLANPPQSGAVVAPAQVLISLQDSLTLAAPGATTTARPLTCRPGLGLFGSQLCMTIAVAIGVAVQRSAALRPTWALRPQRHGEPSK